MASVLKKKKEKDSHKEELDRLATLTEDQLVCGIDTSSVHNTDFCNSKSSFNLKYPECPY